MFRQWRADGQEGGREAHVSLETSFGMTCDDGEVHVEACHLLRAGVSDQPGNANEAESPQKVRSPCQMLSGTGVRVVVQVRQNLMQDRKREKKD